MGKQIGFISTDENDYFTRTLKELEQNDLTNVLNLKNNKTLILPKVQQYIDYLQYLTFESNSYVEIITFMYTMEKVYLGWAEYNVAQKQFHLIYLINIKSGLIYIMVLIFLNGFNFTK